MKNTKCIAVALFAGLLLQSAALSQTNDQTNDASSVMTSNVVQLSTSPDEVAPTSSPVVVPISSNAETAVTVSSNMPMVETNTAVAETTNPMPPEVTNTLVPEVTNNLPLAGSNMSQTAETAAAAPAEEQATNAAPAVTNAPVNAPIQFADTPITAAIELLARTAGINYLLDPRIGYNQPDQNGQIKPEPTISAHWDNVTPQQALLALLDNYGLELIDNPKTHIARITIKEPGALPPLITRVVQLKYASTSNMMLSVESSLTDRRSRIVPDPRTSQLVVIATDPEQASIDTLIAELDKPTRQVLIETRLVELSSNPQTSKGIDWSGTLQAQNFSFGNGVLNAVGASASQTTLPGTPVTITTPGFGGHPASTTTTTPGSTTTTTLSSEPQASTAPGGLSLNTASGLTPDIGFLSADGVKAVFSFLNQSSEAQVVSTPRVVTLDNEMATISVTRQFPVINVTASTQNTTGGSSINYSNIGTMLQVTPRITANDYIWLKVVPDVSSFFGVDTEQIGPGQTIHADIFDSRHIETQVLIPNAHTLVMGGLVKDNPNAGYTKVPILGDIPILGFAFRSETKSLDKDNLLIFITPTIVKDSDFKPMQSDFLNSRPQAMGDPMNPHTWWDGAEARGNWSNPITPTVDKNQTVEQDATPSTTSP